MAAGTRSTHFDDKSFAEPTLPRDAAHRRWVDRPAVALLVTVVGPLILLSLMAGSGPGSLGGARTQPSLAAAALRGSWEGVGPGDAPNRIEVEAVHPGWAVVHYNWRDNPLGQAQRGWIQARAKVSPEGGLYWQNAGEFTLHLSADRTRLVGTRESGGKQATVELRRIESVRLQATPSDRG